MQHKVLIVKNVARQSKNAIEQLLDDRKIKYQVVRLDRGEEIPSPRGYNAMIVLGGTDSANDSLPHIAHTMQRIKEAIDSGIPYFGVCLGLQLLVKATGGQITKSPAKEMGFRAPDGKAFRISFTSAGKFESILQGVPNRFPTFQMHEEMAVISNRLQLLATGEFCPNQMVKIGDNAYGVQFHPEITEGIIQEIYTTHGHLFPLGGEQLMHDFYDIEEQYTEANQKIITNFLTIVGL